MKRKQDFTVVGLTKPSGKNKIDDFQRSSVYDNKATNELSLKIRFARI